MKRTWKKYVVFLTLAAVVLAACGQEEMLTATPTEEVIVEEIATNTPEPAEPTPTATATEPPPTETPVPTETPEPTPTEEVIAEVSDHCLACHSDKDQLVANAKPEEQAPSESSGVG